MPINLTPDQITIISAREKLEIPISARDDMALAQSFGGWLATTDELRKGNVALNAKNETFLFGAATAPLTGTGIFIGKDGSDYEFRIGDPSGSYFHYDGTDITITGGSFQTATSGQRITINAADNYIRIYDATTQIGSIGASLDATARFIDFGIPSGSDLELMRLIAHKTTGTNLLMQIVTKGYQGGLRIRNENTNVYRDTNDVDLLEIYQLGTGTGIRFTDNSTYSTGVPIYITMSKVDNVNPIMKIEQNAITETNFRRIFTETNTGCSIWIGDGTDPDGNLTGVVGDICLNGPGGVTYYCDTAGKNWTAM